MILLFLLGLYLGCGVMFFLALTLLVKNSMSLRGWFRGPGYILGVLALVAVVALWPLCFWLEVSE